MIYLPSCHIVEPGFRRIISIKEISFSFISEMPKKRKSREVSPITCIRYVNLYSILFKSSELAGIICSVINEVFVDHEEPVDALGMAQATWKWPLGDLPEGKK